MRDMCFSIDKFFLKYIFFSWSDRSEHDFQMFMGQNWC